MVTVHLCPVLLWNVIQVIDITHTCNSKWYFILIIMWYGGGWPTMHCTGILIFSFSKLFIPTNRRINFYFYFIGLAIGTLTYLYIGITIHMDRYPNGILLYAGAWIYIVLLCNLITKASHVLGITLALFPCMYLRT